MGKKELKDSEGLYINKCNSIHMFFMKFSIDVIFLDKNKKVCEIITIKPWRISKIIKDAVDVVELKEGSANDNNIEIGDLLEVTNN